MFIDLTDVLKYEDASKELDLKLDIKQIEFNGENFIFKEPITLKGKVSNIQEQLLLTGKVYVKLALKCFRCRETILFELEFNIKEILVKDNSKDYSDEQIILKENGVNIDEIVINNLILNMPMKVLCSDDCKGLCSICGTNLNIKHCECKVEKIDPRLEKLKDFFK